MSDLREAARALLEAIDNVGIVASHDTAAALHSAVGSLRAALAAEEGRVSVPREPTEAMLLAASAAGDSGYTGTWTIDPADCWRAMLAAAEKKQS